MRTPAGETVEWRLLKPDPAAATATNQREFAAWETARLIRQYHREADRGDSAYSEIVVLARTHTEMNTLLPILEQAGIPVVSSGAQTFYRQPEVLDALNLLIALHNPHDPLAVGALLRSPLFGLSDEQIHRVLGETHAADLFHGDRPLPPALPEPARPRVEQLRCLARERRHQALAEWLRRVRAFVPAGVYARHDPEGRAVARIDNVLAAYREVVELGTITPFAWLLEQRARADRSDDFDADLGEDVSVTDESMAAVRVMTIHKAKGLQGTFVIVYGWQTTLDGRRPKRSRKRKPLQLTDTSGRTVRGYQLDWGPLTIVSPGYPPAETLDQVLESEEAKRLTYVAATRARDRLVLLSPHDNEANGGLVAASSSDRGQGSSIVTTLNGTLQVSLAESRQGEPRGRVSGLEIGDPAAHRQTWTERAAALAAPPVPLLQRPSGPEQAAETDAVEEADYVGGDDRAKRDLALRAGTLAHRYLEQHLTEPRFDEDKLRGLAEEPVDPAALQKAIAGLVGLFGSDRHRRAVAARVLGREIPIYLAADGASWAGVIDLVLEEDETIIGVDYKLMTEPAALPAEYQQQQRIYTETLARLFPDRNVRFEFWWLDGST